MVGLDSALSRTGVGVVHYDGIRCTVSTFVVKTDTVDHGSLRERFDRINAVISCVAHHIPPEPAELALIEGPAWNASHGNAWDRSVVWWGLVGIFLHRDVPIAVIAPATLKKWITGYGGSAKHKVTKRDVVAAMRALYPHTECAQSELRHHECEALAAATICAQRLGWPVPTRAHHPTVFLVVKWPGVP